MTSSATLLAVVCLGLIRPTTSVVMGDSCWGSTFDILNSEVNVISKEDLTYLYNQERTYVLCMKTYVIGSVDRNAAVPVASGGDYPLVVINPNLRLLCEIPGTCILSGASPQITNLQDNTLVLNYLGLLARTLPAGRFVDSSNLSVEGVTFSEGTTDQGFSGVYLLGPGTNRTFSDCTWTDNSNYAAIAAGGTGSENHLDFESLTVKDSVIRDNNFEHSIIDGYNCWAQNPARIVSSITFDNTIIRDNRVRGIDPDGFTSLFPMIFTSLIFKDSKVFDNVAERAAAFIPLIDSDVVFENTVFENNELIEDLDPDCQDAVQISMKNGDEPTSCWAYGDFQDVVTFNKTGCKEAFIGPLCFSGENVVNVLGKGTISMKDVRIGDQIMVKEDMYDTIYSFGHRDTEIKSKYLQLATKEAKIELSRDHMIFSNGEAVAANAIRIGDLIDREDGKSSIVLSINEVVRKGAFAPFTKSGAISVNGFSASCYVDMKTNNNRESDQFFFETFLSMQFIAHLFTAPRRLLFTLSASKDNDEELYNNGIPSWVAAGHDGATWILRQNDTVAVMIFIHAILLFSVFGAIEWLLNHHGAAQSVIVVLAVTYLVCRRKKDSSGKTPFIQ